MIPSTTLQDAVALLTMAMNATDTHELGALIEEFREKDDSDELMLAVVALCRSLCLASSKLIHVLDDALSDAQADELTDADLLPIAMKVIQSYARAAATDADASTQPDPQRPA